MEWARRAGELLVATRHNVRAIPCADGRRCDCRRTRAQDGRVWTWYPSTRIARGALRALQQRRLASDYARYPGRCPSDVTASKGTAHRCTLCAPQLRGGALRVLEVSEQRRTDLPIRLVVEAFQSKRRSENRVQPRLLCVRMNPRIHRASAMPQWPASMLREGDLMQKGRCIERGASVCGRVWWLGHCPQDTDPAQRFYAILDRLRHRTPQLRAAERGTAYIKSAARERVRGNTST